MPKEIFSADGFHAHSNLTKFYKKDSLADIRKRAGDPNFVQVLLARLALGREGLGEPSG